MSKAYSIIDDNVNKSATNKTNSNKEGSAFASYEPLWGLDEIILRPSVKESLEDAIAFCRNREKIISEWNLGRFLKGMGGCLGINLFGEPGTGKSIAAEAIAKSIGRLLIRVKLSEILDSLHGKTEKNLSELFETAEKNNLIILFDEADGLLSRRTSAGSANSETNNQMKSHMLTLLDRSNVIVIFTTNFFKNYDRAFIRRILFNIGFPNPSKEELVSLWEFHLNDSIPKQVTYQELADLSEDLTGGDIKKLTLTLCVKLSSNRIVSINRETVQREIEKYKNSIKASNPISEASTTNSSERVVPESQVPEEVKKSLT
jgi:SpoVK/Ycf46/Vps4 family AAA+-type ATPase